MQTNQAQRYWLSVLCSNSRSPFVNTCTVQIPRPGGLRTRAGFICETSSRLEKLLFTKDTVFVLLLAAALSLTLGASARADGKVYLKGDHESRWFVSKELRQDAVISSNGTEEMLFL